ncbi:AMP-binding protein [Streptomyces sp. NPDC005859]|uniref:AMP-binding protein n=1 Tax=Streptomyces sp. NPDC005859 TaxID=3157170 RepID=UPI0033C2C351
MSADMRRCLVTSTTDGTSNRCAPAKTAANLRVAVAGGSSLPVEVLTEFEKRFDAPVLEGFGVSATSGAATFNHRDRPRGQGAVGLPFWDAQVRSGA